MKITPEISNVINLVNKEGDYRKNVREREETQGNVEDVVSLENKVASRSRVESVEEARMLLSDVMNGVDESSSSVHSLNQYRVSRLFS